MVSTCKPWIEGSRGLRLSKQLKTYRICTESHSVMECVTLYRTMNPNDCGLTDTENFLTFRMSCSLCSAPLCNFSLNPVGQCLSLACAAIESIHTSPPCWSDGHGERSHWEEPPSLTCWPFLLASCQSLSCRASEHILRSLLPSPM